MKLWLVVFYSFARMTSWHGTSERAGKGAWFFHHLFCFEDTTPAQSVEGMWCFGGCFKNSRRLSETAELDGNSFQSAKK
ncbi:hypothetical protein BJ741DRAFT_208284 [Chytriomyces cf. hyalinus JEL632]|nr:hypothetical protein BJ741DRAFT_208284 [Chytriomyces cf. hyalinus JEL632]